MIVIGSVIIIISGLGCIGVGKNSKCMLVPFTVTIIITSLVVIAMIVFLSVSPTATKPSDTLKARFREYFDHGKFDYEQEMTKFQAENECCGMHGPQDFDAKNLLFMVCEASNEGCVDKLGPELDRIFYRHRRHQLVTNPLFIVLLVTLAFLLLTATTSFCLLCSGDGRSG